MKKLLFIFPLLVIFVIEAQNIKKQPSSIPDFDIIQADGTHFKAVNLKKGIPFMMVYFDPDCDHCELFIVDMLRQMNAFKDIQIVLVTYVPVQTLKAFVTKTGLQKFPEIKTGTEGHSFKVRYHYNVVQFPYLALHDSNGKLFATYENDVPPATEVADMF